MAVAIAGCSVLLGACATTMPEARTGGPLPPTPMQCDAGPAQRAIGQTADADTIERIRVDTHSRSVRVLRPGQMVTMEFSAERVNVRVDEHNAIIGISCG